MPAIVCVQRQVAKTIPTDEDLIITDRNALGNKVGSITNRITSMLEVQSKFSPDSLEYKILEYRIMCGQLFQQNEIDKLKGIVAEPMPTHWYSFAACDKDKFQQSICADKKPYFMTYVYADYRKKYLDYVAASNKNAKERFGVDIQEIQVAKRKSKEKAQFLDYYTRKSPFGMTDCSINKICYYIEREFAGYVTQVKQANTFNYSYLKTAYEYSNEIFEQCKQLALEYTASMKAYKDTLAHKKTKLSSDAIQFKTKNALKAYYKREVCKICPDANIRMNIFLDLNFGHKIPDQFMWDCVGDLIIERIKELQHDNS